ncbi:MAG: prolipoprotein diacylglyceryl transferase [Planctomycetota bacterium]|jgi:phosphatidylglycerol:prolipoprotein diacylglycerol transferase
MTILAESYIHDLSPFAVRLSDTFGIRWYGLAYLSGFVAAWLILKWMARTGRSLLRPEQVGDFMTWMVVGVLVGGRLGYVLFYSIDLLWTFTPSVPFWGVLEIHKGGMASHGGILGVFLACLLYGRSRGITPWHLFDGVAFCAPIGLGLGRLANFVNGELWGRPLPAAMQADPPAWSVKYPDELLDPAFPNGENVDGFVTMIADGASSPALLAPRQALRDAIYAGRDDVAEAVAPYLVAYYPSQLFQALTDGLLLFTLLAIVWWRPRVPGVVCGWFLIGYGVMRIVSEQFRAQYETRWGISSIWPAAGLSAVMIALGLGVLWWCARRGASPIGGLRGDSASRSGSTPETNTARP